uniref:Uncharacterized protein n=1 Tax=Knipowitschia caucasica TaxID=637954 RepID=A0AAV2KJS0_KNICA
MARDMELGSTSRRSGANEATRGELTGSWYARGAAGRSYPRGLAVVGTPVGSSGVRSQLYTSALLVGLSVSCKAPSLWVTGRTIVNAVHFAWWEG